MNYLRAARNWLPVTANAVKWGMVAVPVARVIGPNELSRYCMWRWCRDTCNQMEIRRSLHNGHLLHGLPQCVYVANHQSLLDILILGCYLERDYRWVSKDAIFRVPFLGQHLRYSGHIPVYRGEKASEENSKLPQRIKGVVEQGADILFFPEGTRCRDGKLQPFRIGAFMTAVLNDLPVVPLVIRGTGALLFKGARDLALNAEKDCSVTVLDRVEVPRLEGASNKERAELMSRVVRARMARELGELDDSETEAVIEAAWRGEGAASA